MTVLTKAILKVEKIKKTIARHEAKADKKLATIKKNGWEPDTSLYDCGKNREAYWAVCVYEVKLDEIKSANRRLADAEKVMQSLKQKYLEGSFQK